MAQRTLTQAHMIGLIGVERGGRGRRALHRFSYGVMDMYLVIVRIGQATAKSAASMQLTAALSPFVFGEVVASNVALSGRAQVEAILFVASRLSVFFPKWIEWVLKHGFLLVTRWSSGSLCGAVSVTTLLAKQSLAMQVMAVGLHANAVSAMATTTIQIALNGFLLMNKAVTNPSLAVEQFYYDTVTAVSSGCTSVAGACLGTAVGALLFPGVGTALGSLIGSLSGGLVPYMVRRNGPEVRWKRTRQAAVERYNLQRKLNIFEEENNWMMITDFEGDSDFTVIDSFTVDNDIKEETKGKGENEREKGLFLEGAESEHDGAAREKWDVWDVEAESWTTL